MIKINSISGLVYNVSNPSKTADFYEDMGFLVGKKEEKYASVRVNWFWVDFVQSKPVGSSGQFLHVSVTDVDKTYDALKSKGLKPSEPKNTSSGRTETTITDPDGYNLVFFQKKK